MKKQESQFLLGITVLRKWVRYCLLQKAIESRSISTTESKMYDCTSFGICQLRKTFPA